MVWAHNRHGAALSSGGSLVISLPGPGGRSGIVSLDYVEAVDASEPSPYDPSQTHHGSPAQKPLIADDLHVGRYDGANATSEAVRVRVPITPCRRKGTPGLDRLHSLSILSSTYG